MDSKVLNRSFATTLKEYGLVTIGVLAYALGWTIFLLPNNLIGGGVSGFASILMYATGIPMGVTYFVINVLLLIIGTKILGTGFGGKTIYAIVMTSIMLGIMPLTNRQLRHASNDVHFAVMTSGYNSVTNGFLIESMKMALDFIEKNEIQMIHYPDFFEEGYKNKYDKDIYHYLDSVARDSQYEMNRGFCHRLIRCSVVVWGFKNIEELKSKYREVIDILTNSYDGEKNTADIQRLKGMIREFEEELVWAYNGVQVKNVHHLRLGFYHDSSSEQMQKDVITILNQFREIKPNIISLVIDPEGSGPDTHYKVLQATAAAIEEWSKECDLSNLKILGYRNVWFKFHPAEANVYIPVSLNAFAVLEKSFAASYLTQVKAEFPNPELDGPFSKVSSNTWIKQLRDIQLILGKDYFYENESPLIRATHGLIFLKEMNVEELLELSREMRSRSEQAI